MSETYENFPEIRKDLNYEMVAETYQAFQQWSKLYEELPNVKVIYQPRWSK